MQTEQSLMADADYNKAQTTPDQTTSAAAAVSQAAASVDNKYGGLVPKKKPLITKDHQRAFFDSADWALYKQGAGEKPESTVPIETLQPKLKRTPHQQLPPRRPTCTS